MASQKWGECLPQAPEEPLCCFARHWAPARCAKSCITLVTYGAHDCGAPRGSWQALPEILASIGVARTLFMEDRAIFGPCLDLQWPPAPQPFQVCYVISKQHQ